VKLTLKLILVLCLFSSIAFADGEMGGGGEGDMTNGGKTCPQGQTCRPDAPPSDQSGDDANQTDSILNFIRTYLGSILG
jgi:hypothetical protein